MKKNLPGKLVITAILSAAFVLNVLSCVKQNTSSQVASEQSAAASAANAPAGVASLTYLSPVDVNVTGILAPPPEAGSAADKIDNGVLHLLQSSRSPAECARAQSEVPVTLDSFMGPAFGPLSADEVARLNLLFAAIVPEAKFFSGLAKAMWKRPRPYDEDNTLTPCIDKDNSSAYPSGHATVSRVFGQILKAIYPDRAAAFMTRADQIAFDRVLGGVHHPADVLAGQALGDAIARALLQKDSFKKALSAATQPAH